MIFLLLGVAMQLTVLVARSLLGSLLGCNCYIATRMLQRCS